MVNEQCHVKRVRRHWRVVGGVGVALAILVGTPAAGQAVVDAGRQSAVVPQLPERIQDELELDDLRREKERRDLEIELGVNHDLQEMRKLLDLLTTAEEVQDKLKTNPELRDRYEAIVGGAGRARSCTCLINARVLWLGPTGGTGAQAGQADIRLDEDIHNVTVGGTIGNSRCRLARILAGRDAATPSRAVLSCGGTERERQLYSAAIGR